LGLDEFSMSPVVIPEVKYVISNVRFEDARKVAEQALSLPTGEEIEAFTNKRLNELIPWLKKTKKSA
ncbi:MAG: hypothetical protein AAB157_01995, partial [Candidatus Omnitrophota bacterium]